MKANTAGSSSSDKGGAWAKRGVQTAGGGKQSDATAMPTIAVDSTGWFLDTERQPQHQPFAGTSIELTSGDVPDIRVTFGVGGVLRCAVGAGDVGGDVNPDHERNWGTLSWLRTTEDRCSSNTRARRWAGSNGHDRAGLSAPILRPPVGFTPTGLNPTPRSPPPQAPVVIVNGLHKHPPVPGDLRGPLGRSGAPCRRGAGRTAGAVADQTSSRVSRRWGAGRYRSIHRRGVTGIIRSINGDGRHMSRHFA